jgi:hypothetical protein
VAHKIEISHGQDLSRIGTWRLLRVRQQLWKQ